MSSNAIRENKILTKISEYTVTLVTLEKVVQTHDGANNCCINSFCHGLLIVAYSQHTLTKVHHSLHLRIKILFFKAIHVEF